MFLKAGSEEWVVVLQIGGAMLLALNATEAESINEEDEFYDRDTVRQVMFTESRTSSRMSPIEATSSFVFLCSLCRLQEP
jgi:hypothetical protein